MEISCIKFRVLITRKWISIRKDKGETGNLNQRKVFRGRISEKTHTAEQNADIWFSISCGPSKPAGADPGFGQGGAQPLRPKVADVVKRSCVSEVSNLWLGSRAHLRALEAFGFLMLKYAFSHILETLFLSFLTSILTPKVDENRALDFTSINLRHSYILHLFFNLHEKVML